MNPCDRMYSLLAFQPMAIHCDLAVHPEAGSAHVQEEHWPDAGEPVASIPVCRVPAVPFAKMRIGDYGRQG